MARAPRKTAAKKTAAKQSRHAWPFGEGKYLSTPSINKNAVSSGPSVETLRAALGLGPGIYDGPTRKAVIEAQRAAGVGWTGVVVESDWHLIVNGVVPEDATPAVD